MKSSLAVVSSLLCLMVAGAFAPVRASSASDMRAPDLPPSLVAPEGNKVSFHVFAVGVQIYAWTGSGWVFQAPEANLFAGSTDYGLVGGHYAGPTWESNSGSKVMGRRLAGVTVDSTAIPWLLLQAESTEGAGILPHSTYIQRVNTTGGLAPTTDGTFVGEVARIYYTAEYYFYRAQI